MTSPSARPAAPPNCVALRETFECWAQSQPPGMYPLERMTNNKEFYRSARTQNVWDGWKGAVEMLTVNKQENMAMDHGEVWKDEKASQAIFTFTLDKGEGAETLDISWEGSDVNITVPTDRLRKLLGIEAENGG